MIFKIFTAFTFFLFTSLAYASCDFSKDIRSNPDGSFTYSRACHIEAGKAINSVSIMEERILGLEKKLELKDLMITRYDDRAQLWMDTSFKLNDRLQTYESLKATDRWTSFGLGVIMTVVSVWAAGQINR
jgi:hypothetical protein